MSIEGYERIAATLESPMSIVTVRTGDDRDGCLVGFSTQCSIDPTRYLVCLSAANRTFRLARHAATLVVHVLRDDPHDRSLASLFGEETGDEVDKLRQCAWRPGPGQTPVLDGCDWFSGAIVDRVDLGDHVGFVLAVDDGAAQKTGLPTLGYASVRDLDAGKPAESS
jgi:flavin reductase (DIM6/NTAB) family NADH-FMN oxidoreductase RutF